MCSFTWKMHDQIISFKSLWSFNHLCCRLLTADDSNIQLNNYTFPAMSLIIKYQCKGLSSSSTTHTNSHTLTHTPSKEQKTCLIFDETQWQEDSGDGAQCCQFLSAEMHLQKASAVTAASCDLPNEREGN